MVVRKKASKDSNDAAQKVVKRELSRQHPSLHYKGAARSGSNLVTKKSVKGKKNLLNNNEGRTYIICIIDVDHGVHKCNIEFQVPVSHPRSKVNDVTLLTKEDENKRKQIAIRLLSKRFIKVKSENPKVSYGKQLLKEGRGRG